MTNSKFTNEVYQNSMKDNESEYIPEKHQPYFEFDCNGSKQLIGLDQILLCLRVAEKANEIPPMSLSFWQSVSEDCGINYFDVDNKNLIKSNIFCDD